MSIRQNHERSEKYMSRQLTRYRVDVKLIQNLTNRKSVFVSNCVRLRNTNMQICVIGGVVHEEAR